MQRQGYSLDDSIGEGPSSPLADNTQEALSSPVSYNYDALPLQPSLRSRASSQYSECDSNSRSWSWSSASYPAASSSASSSRTNLTLQDKESFSEPFLDDSIPRSARGVQLHVRPHEFTIITPSTSSHRLVSVHVDEDLVKRVRARKVKVNPSTCSIEDVMLSAAGPEHVAVVRRSGGAHKPKLMVTVYNPESENDFEVPATSPKQLLDDFSSKDATSSILVMVDSALYLLGDKHPSHVWSLDVSESGSAQWRQVYRRSIPRPNARPSHASGCPRAGVGWKNNLIILSPEPVASKKFNRPYASPIHKLKLKPKKIPQFPNGQSSFLRQESSGSVKDYSLVIWQYSIPNQSWMKRVPVSTPPQGSGVQWPVMLQSSLVSENTVLVAVGREEGTCLWTLDLQSLAWSELPATLPPKARVHSMSSLGSMVYLMGEGLSLDESSTIVQFDVSVYEAWDTSRHSGQILKPIALTPSAPLASKPPTPTPETSTFDLEISPHPPLQMGGSAASILPAYDHHEPQPLDSTLSVLLWLTPYRRLHEARTDADFESIGSRLTSEWISSIHWAQAFLAVDAAILGFQKGSTILTIDQFTEEVLAVSLLASLVTLGVAKVLFLMYHNTDGAQLRQHARDNLNTYAVFSIQARIPLLTIAIAFLAHLLIIGRYLKGTFASPVWLILGFLLVPLAGNYIIYGFYLVAAALRWLWKQACHVWFALFRWRGQTPSVEDATPETQGTTSVDSKAGTGDGALPIVVELKLNNDDGDDDEKGYEVS